MATITLTAQIVCDSDEAAQGFLANLYAAVSGLYPDLMTSDDPTSVTGPFIRKTFYDAVFTWQSQQAAGAAVAAVSAGLEAAMAGVPVTANVTVD